MKYFLIRTARFALIGIIPIVILLSLYLMYDPFRVIYNYNDYSNPYVTPNRDYISTQMFIKNYERYSYNSFIFGSSRTLAFKPSSWSNYLPPHSRPFMFDASSESIFGIYTKLKYLDSINAKIDNALIILCRDVSFYNSPNSKGHIFIKHPATSLESKLLFHYTFFKTYLTPVFFYNFHYYTYTKKFEPYMAGYIEDRKITYDTISNELKIIDQENELTKSPDRYYAKRKGLFYERLHETNDSIQRINPKFLFMLKEVKRILEKNNTQYKVVISPLYEQVKFNSQDLSILKNIFGSELYDFSGKNSFTDSKTNYYETSHYRPNVGDSILKAIYKQSANVQPSLYTIRGDQR